MNEILNMTMNEMAGVSFACGCGRQHTFGIEHLAIGKGTLPKLAEFAAPFREQPVTMISDNHTFEAAGKKALQLMEDEGFDVNSYVFQTGDGILIPDERTVGRVMMEIRPGTGLIIAVGSGTLNDTAKYISSRTGIPYIIVCTAPSMDGYVSHGAPLICEGRKISYVAELPYGVVADTDIMKEAPMRLIQAGFGDVLGKWTALADWYLAREIAGEECCETCVTMVKRALEKVTAHARGIAERDETAILYLIEALMQTGVAMALVGISRPASGAEHLLSHYWEMEYIAREKFPELHGIKVGIATPVIAEVFELMRDDIPDCVMELVPSREEAEALLAAAGAPVLPQEAGIDRELFYRGLTEAYSVRDRYSVLELAVQKGRMEEIAETITKRIYGEAISSTGHCDKSDN